MKYFIIKYGDGDTELVDINELEQLERSKQSFDGFTYLSVYHRFSTIDSLDEQQKQHILEEWLKGNK